MEGRIQPLEAPPLRHRIYESLEALILSGELRPGEHLSEVELAAQFGTSRAPVREALQLLQRERLVDIRPRQGAFVHKPSLREVDDIFAVRRALEVEVTERAAAMATPDDIRALHAVLDAARRAAADGDRQELVEANSLFHSELTRVAGNEMLQSMIGWLEKRIRCFFEPVVKLRGPGSYLEHRAIADAIARGDCVGAATLMRNHIEATRQTYRENYDEAGRVG
jgi:DNA-binding GntR family transcriptional regulator